MVVKKMDPEVVATIQKIMATRPCSVRTVQKILEAEYSITVSRGAVHKVMRAAGSNWTQGTKTIPTNVVDPLAPVIRSFLIRQLRRGWMSLTTLAEMLGVPKGTARETIQHLQGSGYNVSWTGDQVCIVPEPPIGGYEFHDKSPLQEGAKVFGALGDTHLCSKFQRLDVLEAAYDEYARQGITHVYHTGNIVDGECRFNKYDLYAHGITDQALYCLDHYPQRAGITTYFITADDHEGWWMQREGLDFGRYLVFEAQEQGRTDLKWLGYQEADVKFKTPKGSHFIRLSHPGGGTAYALSYATQKLVESLQGGEKPGLILVGHYHKAIYHMVRNVHIVQTGTCCDQTTFMRKRKLEAHVGFWTVKTRQDATGAVREVTPTFTNYFDRGYHSSLTISDG